MTLPKIDTPVFELTLPLTKQRVQYRPFLVKEQKILLLAIDSKDSKFSSDNIKQILKNCCLSDINIDKLPIVDIEYFFIGLRAKSVGEIIETIYRCQNRLEDDTICSNPMPVSYNLLDIKVDEHEVNDKIELTPTIGVKMKYPTYGTIEKIDTDKDPASIAFDFMLKCIDFIYDEDNVYYAKETSREELEEFFDSLNIEQFNKIQKFFESIPKLQKVIDITCSKCGFEHKIVIEGLENFFE